MRNTNNQPGGSGSICRTNWWLQSSSFRFASNWETSDSWCLSERHRCWYYRNEITRTRINFARTGVQLPKSMCSWFADWNPGPHGVGQKTHLYQVWMWTAGKIGLQGNRKNYDAEVNEIWRNIKVFINICNCLILCSRFQSLDTLRKV